MKRIPLTPLSQGRFALVDDADYDYLMQWKWHAAKNYKRFYALRSTWKNKKRITIMMHREIMQPPKNLQIDHIDHDGLNCQRSNMRICTLQQNCRNRDVSINSRSKYKGVAITGKYISATIWIDKKTTYLGRFKTEEAAARAYDAKAKELFGEFANLNFKD